MSPQLQAFLSVVNEKTVHAAAERLHITQTAVTQRIKTLENRLSVSLFVRTRRGMLLTKEGEVLLRYCHSFQDLEGEALTCMRGAGSESNVSIVISGPLTIMRTRIIPQCIHVMQQFPQLIMNFKIDDDESRVTSLRHGDSDMVIIDPCLLSDEMEYKQLKPEEYVLVVSPKWQRRELQDVIKNEKIIDFDQRDQTTFNYLKKQDLFDVANKDRHFTNRTDTLTLLISEGVGYGVLPMEFAQPYLRDNTLYLLNGNKTYSNLLVLAWFPRHQKPTYFASLINACV